MMQPELLQASWPFYEIINSAFDHVDQYGVNMENHVGGGGGVQYPSLFTAKQEASEEGSTISFNSNMFLNDYSLEYGTPHLPSLEEDFSVELEAFDPVSSDKVDGSYQNYKGVQEGEESFPSQQMYSTQRDHEAWSPSSSLISDLSNVSSVKFSLVLPKEDMELDNQLSIRHLLEAYGEAIEKQQKELAEVILKCIYQKVSPLGETYERLSFNLSQGIENQGDYLRQEAIRNFKDAFKAFYQIFPHGRFAHFAANSAFFEFMPDGADVIHAVDFDIGEGVQWPPLIEAIAHQGKKIMKLTSINWGRDSVNDSPLLLRFEETRRQLIDHASTFGLKLIMEEKGIQGLKDELMITKEKGTEKEWFIFNCMVSLPHMGRRRNRSHVMEFLRLAEEFVYSSVNDAGEIERGIIALGDGDAGEVQDNCSSFGSYFNGHIMYYQALLDSIGSNFPDNLAEARTAMECLFVTPYISSLAWSQKWEDMRQGHHLQAAIGLEGRILSKELMMELEEMVKLQDSSYEVRGEKENYNQVALVWKQTPLVRVTVW